jgi:hypothetical protein
VFRFLVNENRLDVEAGKRAIAIIHLQAAQASHGH